MSNELNDPKKWLMKGQTRIKHQVLDSYLAAFSVILTRGNPMGQRTNLHYIDGFAGRGAYQDGEPGSPIIAMQVADKVFKDTQGKAVLKIQAIELDDENFESLHSETRKAAQLHPDASVQLHHGSFVEHIGPIVSRLGTVEYAFIFIDPFGYKDAVEFERVVNLISRPRTEVFITFMSHNISRYLSDSTATKDKTMAEIIGNQQLQQLKGMKDRQEMLVKLYGEQIQTMAKAQGIENVLIYTTGVKYEDQEQNIYHLIHVSRDAKARLEMEKAVKRASLLVEPPPMLLMYFQPEIEQLALAYLSSKPGRRATARDVAGAMWTKFWDLTWLGNVRSVLLDLERAGTITITRPGAKPRTAGKAIEEKDMVQLSR